MASGIIDRNIKALQKTIKENLAYVDINHKGYVEGGESVLRDGQAIINEYIMWLKSDKWDYSRRYGAGGFCEGNLNRYPFDPSSEELISNDLIAATAERFPYIQVIGLTVECAYQKRQWVIKLAVKDTLTGLIGTTGNSGLEVPAGN